jgi:hypothetical protein
MTRKLDKQALASATHEISAAEQLLKENNLDAAANAIENILKMATIPCRQRRAQIWFDAECYKERKKTLQALHTAKETNRQRDLQDYSEIRRKYKNLIKAKKSSHIETEGRKLAEAAQKDPYIALRPRRAHNTKEINMEAWEKHFTETLTTAYDNTTTEEENGKTQPITQEKVKEAISKAKNKKAAGPDGIQNEYIKQSSAELLDIWTNLLNKCLETGNIPENGENELQMFLTIQKTFFWSLEFLII